MQARAAKGTKGSGKQPAPFQNQQDPRQDRVYCPTAGCSCWVYKDRGVLFCHKCGGKFPHQSLGASGGKGPPQPRRRSAPRLRDQRTYSEAAQSAEPQQPFPPQSQSEPLQTQDPPSAPQVRSVKAKELTAVDKARAMLAATASTYGPDSAEYTEAANKLRKLKHEQLQAKSLPQQIRSLQDQIASGKKRWWKGEEEQEWISQEISRLCARYDNLFAQNDRLGSRD